MAIEWIVIKHAGGRSCTEGVQMRWGANNRLRITIGADWMSQMGWQHGDRLLFGHDPKISIFALKRTNGPGLKIHSSAVRKGRGPRPGPYSGTIQMAESNVPSQYVPLLRDLYGVSRASGQIWKDSDGQLFFSLKPAD